MSAGGSPSSVFVPSGNGIQVTNSFRPASLARSPFWDGWDALGRFGTDRGTDRKSRIINIYGPWDGGTDKLGGYDVMAYCRHARAILALVDRSTCPNQTLPSCSSSSSVRFFRKRPRTRTRTRTSTIRESRIPLSLKLLACNGFGNAMRNANSLDPWYAGFYFCGLIGTHSC